MKYLYFLLLLLGSHNAISQMTYHKRFSKGGYSLRPTDMIPSPDTGNIITAYSNSFGAGDNDLYLIRLSKTGDVVLSKKFGTPYEEKESRCIVTNDGGLAIFCTNENIVKRKGVYKHAALFIKCTKDGDVEWVKRFVLSDSALISPKDLIQTGSGDYIMAYSKYGSSNNFGLIRLMQNGSLVWHTALESKISGGDYFRPSAILSASNGKIYLAGDAVNESQDAGATGTVMTFNSQGVPASFKYIDAYPYTYSVSTHAMRLYEKDKQAYLFGNYYSDDDHYYFLPLQNNATTATAITTGGSKESLQHFLRVHVPFILPQKYGYNTCFNKDGTYTVAETYAKRDVFRYDTLNRRCPVFYRPVINTDTGHNIFSLVDVQYIITNDQVSLFDAVVTDSVVDVDYTICSGIAPDIKKNKVADKDTQEILISPNPADDHIYVNHLDASVETLLTITDVQGSAIKRLRVQAAGWLLDIHDLKSGIYFLKIESGQASHTFRFTRR